MHFFQLVKEPSISLGGLGWFCFLKGKISETRSSRHGDLHKSHPISLRPHTVRHELGCVSTWWIVSHCRHCTALLAQRCCFKLRPACWLRPVCGVVSACVVLFQAHCGGCGGYCAPFLGVLSHTDVLVYVTGQFFRTATVLRYETPLFPQSFTSDTRSIASKPGFWRVCVCARARVCMHASSCVGEEICLCDWVTCIVCKKKK